LKIKKFFSLIFFSLIISSCKSINNEESLKDQTKNTNNLEKETMEIRFSCGDDSDEGISKYIEDGWKIAEEYSEEKICTWKSFPASKGCNMEKDKGCKITKPDKIGVEKIYLLEK
jgi:hypothetical protein